MLALFSCKKAETTSENERLQKDFYQNGVHVTVVNGTPLDTRAQGEGYNSFTIAAEKEGKTIVLYTIDTYSDRDFITSETFFPDGTKLSTAIIYQGKVVSYVVNPDLDELKREDSPETRSLSRWWHEFIDCVNESADEMMENLTDNAIDRATCEWIPCETVCVAVSAFNCLTGQ